MANPRYAVLKLDAPIMPVIRLGRPEISAEDVTLACAGLSRSRFLFVRLVWLGEEKTEPELVREALLEAVGIEEVRRNHSRLPDAARKGILASMIRLALSEHRESRICKTCNGVAEMIHEGKIIACEACSGAGRIRHSQRWVAQKIGKDHRSYARYWRPTYEAIYRMISGWEHEICKEMAKRLRTDVVAA